MFFSMFSKQAILKTLFSTLYI